MTRWSTNRSPGHRLDVLTTRHAAVAACGLLALAGCASMAPRVGSGAAIDVPDAWSVTVATAAASLSSLVGWWLRFDDPLLANLIADALRSNKPVTGAQAALRQARTARGGGGRVTAHARELGLGSAQLSSGSSNAAPALGGTTTKSFQAGLDANWELDLFGVHRNALAATEATARASAASLGDVQVSIAAELALAYITLRNAQARLAIAYANLASQQETLQITQWRQQAGLVTSLEAEQGRAAAEQTGALVRALQIGIDQASHALAVLAGRPPAALAALLADAAPVPPRCRSPARISR